MIPQTILATLEEQRASLEGAGTLSLGLLLASISSKKVSDLTYRCGYWVTGVVVGGILIGRGLALIFGFA